MIVGPRLVFCSYALLCISTSINAFSTLQPLAPARVSAVKSKINSRKASTTQLYAFLNVQSTVLVINKFYQTFPIASAFLTCGAKASAADFVAQLNAATDLVSSDQELKNTNDPLSQNIVEQSFRFELSRNIGFLLYGAIYQGVFQYYLYNVYFPVWFGTSNDIATVTSKVMFDSLLIVPIICLPFAYLTKVMISGGSPIEGMKKYFHDLKHTNLVLHFCAIWIPAKVSNTV